MSVDVKPREMRALGWYAVQWTHVTDWFRSYTKYLKSRPGPPSEKTLTGQAAPDYASTEQPSETTTASRPAQGQATHQDDSDKDQIEVSSDSESPQGKAKEENKSEETKLKEVVEESFSMLAKAKTVFPFTLVRDIITIDRHKLTIIYRNFFNIEQKISVPIENIKNVQADLGPFFGSLTVTSDHFVNNTQSIHWLTRNDARRIQRLVQGAMVALKEEIDISQIDTDKLKKLLGELGEGEASQAAKKKLKI